MAGLSSSSALFDNISRRILRNVSFLGAAHALTAVLGLVTLMIVARALGPTGLGILALIEAYVRAVDKFVRVEAWQGIVRYGARALTEDRSNDFLQLLKLGTLIDLAGAGLAACIAIAGCIVAAPLLGLDAEQTRMAMYYSATLLFALSSTPTAILRLYDRFDILSKVLVLAALARLVLTALAWVSGAGLWPFLLVMMVYAVAEPMAVFALAWWQVRAGSGTLGWRLPLRGVLTRNPGILRFVLNTNFNVVARHSVQRFDTLLVGSIAGPTAAGLYQLARRIGLTVLRLGTPVQQAIYPELARLWGLGERARFVRLVVIVNCALGGVSLLLLLVAYVAIDPLVRLVFGEGFGPAAPLVLLQLVAVTLFLFGTAMGPALMSMGADRAMLMVTVASAIAFFGSAVPLIGAYGAAGGLVGHIVFNLIWLGGCIVVFLMAKGRTPHGAHTWSVVADDSRKAAHVKVQP
jgi:O-antigen/teichoic acid export membrane protein